MFPKINLLFANDISFFHFTFSYFEEFCIGERTRNCVLNCPSQTGTIWGWWSDCCWSWSNSAWWEVAVAPDLIKTNIIYLWSSHSVIIWLKLYWRTPRCRVSYFLISDQIIWALYICISRKCIVNGKLYFLVKFSFREQNCSKVFTIIDCCYIFYRLNPLSLDYLFEPLGKCLANIQLAGQPPWSCYSRGHRGTRSPRLSQEGPGPRGGPRWWRGDRQDSPGWSRAGSGPAWSGRRRAGWCPPGGPRRRDSRRRGAGPPWAGEHWASARSPALQCKSCCRLTEGISF